MRTQAELLLDDANRFAAMDRRKADANAQRLIGEQLLNMPERTAAPRERNRQAQLRPRDNLLTYKPEDYALAFEKRDGETTTEWTARLQRESSAVDKKLQKFGAQKQRLRALSTQTPQEEKKVYSESSKKSDNKPLWTEKSTEFQ